MKLLKDEIIVKESDGIKVTFNPVTTSMQSVLIDFAIKPTFESKVGFSMYGLKSIISSVEINSIPYNPRDLAARSDLDDKDTLAAIFKIGELLDEACFTSTEEKKRQATSAQQSKQDEAV